MVFYRFLPVFAGFSVFFHLKPSLSKRFENFFRFSNGEKPSPPVSISSGGEPQLLGGSKLLGQVDGMLGHPNGVPWGGFKLVLRTSGDFWAISGLCLLKGLCFIFSGVLPWWLVYFLSDFKLFLNLCWLVFLTKKNEETKKNISSYKLFFY